MTTVSLSTTQLEVLYQAQTSVDVSTSQLEILYQPVTSVKVTTVQEEILYQPVVNVRLSTTYVEVLISNHAPVETTPLVLATNIPIIGDPIYRTKAQQKGICLS